MLIYELLSENREQKKPKGFHKPSSNLPAETDTKKLPVKVVFAVRTFWPSYKSNVAPDHERSVKSQLARFIAFKRQDPFANFPGIDRHMDSSNPFPQNEIKHAGLGHNHRLFYSVFRKDAKHNYPGLEDNVVYLVLFGVYTHDKSGTGTQQNRNLQTSLANSFAEERKNVNAYKEYPG